VDKKEKFIAAIKENEGFIYKLASAYTNNTDDKHDLVQEIIYQLWKSFQTFSEQSKLSTWIYRVEIKKLSISGRLANSLTNGRMINIFNGQ